MAAVVVMPELTTRIKQKLKLEEMPGDNIFRIIDGAGVVIGIFNDEELLYGFLECFEWDEVYIHRVNELDHGELYMSFLKEDSLG